MLLSLAQVGEELGVSRVTVWRLVKAGDLAVVDVGRGRPRFRVQPEDLERFIHNRTYAHDADPSAVEQITQANGVRAARRGDD